MMPQRIGFTTTVPVEVILAAGCAPVDLNNVFITHPDPQSLIANAEQQGFPAGVCAWIKGLYAAALREKVDKVIVVVHGDCANSVALGEVFRHRNVPVVEFAFPHKREKPLIEQAINDLADQLDASRVQIDLWKYRLDLIRKKLVSLDDLTWKTGQVRGLENHQFLVASSDFGSNPDGYEQVLNDFLLQAGSRPKQPMDGPRLGIIGVPTILDDLYSVLENKGAHVVFNEVQRQFAMPPLKKDLVSQYENYTYPFDLPFRIQDIREQVQLRKLDGLVHYIQNFCHRQIEDIVIREQIDVPMLSIEGDRPGPTDGRTLTRIEAFLEMLRGN